MLCQRGTRCESSVCSICVKAHPLLLRSVPTGWHSQSLAVIACRLFACRYVIPRGLRHRAWKIRHPLARRCEKTSVVTLQTWDSQAVLRILQQRHRCYVIDLPGVPPGVPPGVICNTSRYVIYSAAGLLVVAAGYSIAINQPVRVASRCKDWKSTSPVAVEAGYPMLRWNLA